MSTRRRTSAAGQPLRDEVARLLTVSRQVYHDCLLPNGALVAAPSHLPIYPARAKSYLYCWPGRDSGFAVAAMEALGESPRGPLLAWLWERAEDFQQTGLIFEEYHPNGPRRGPEWQPDQAGTLLWALCRTGNQAGSSEERVVRRVADALVGQWDGSTFRTRYRDLWERRFASPRHGSYFPYSLAACATGLRLAAEIYWEDAWRQAADQMAARVADAWSDAVGYVLRRSGPVGDDPNIDASLLGLIWPFHLGDALPPDRLRRTVDAIESRLLATTGLARYQFDGYDGEVEPVGSELRQGAGSWPLLTFWLAIVQHRLGEPERALATFRLGLAAADAGGYFPEQVFAPGDPRMGVKPLLWSHMMFVLAAVELLVLPDRLA